MYIKYKDQNIRVSFKHQIEGKNRSTVCSLIDTKTGKVVSEGITKVHKGDSFNKKIGREHSYIRAVRALTDDKAKRISYYKQYSEWGTKEPRLAWAAK